MSKSISKLSRAAPSATAEKASITPSQDEKTTTTVAETGAAASTATPSTSTPATTTNATEKNEKADDSKTTSNEDWDRVVTSFDEMGLKDELLRGIYAYGFEKPSVIQQRGILPILSGHDTIVQAQSGTGKTGTFSIALLQTIDQKISKTQVLVLAPTRELAQQIKKVASTLGDFLRVTSHACVGGTLVREDMKILRDGVQLVVGTPGRVFDMLNRNSLNLSQCKMFILDEADEMLSRGFKDQVSRWIYRYIYSI